MRDQFGSHEEVRPANVIHSNGKKEANTIHNRIKLLMISPAIKEAQKLWMFDEPSPALAVYSVDPSFVLAAVSMTFDWFNRICSTALAAPLHIQTHPLESLGIDPLPVVALMFFFSFFHCQFVCERCQTMSLIILHFHHIKRSKGRGFSRSPDPSVLRFKEKSLLCGKMAAINQNTRTLDLRDYCTMPWISSNDDDKSRGHDISSVPLAGLLYYCSHSLQLITWVCARQSKAGSPQTRYKTWCLLCVLVVVVVM